jgi:uncharacterized protein (DUF952 family)
MPDSAVIKEMAVVYKLVPEALWRDAERMGVFTGAPVDTADGFVHFSTADQVKETAARHFAAQPGLLLVAVAAERLGDALRYEPSRGGELFPHLYAPLGMDAVLSVTPLPLDAEGRHEFPDLAG